MKILFFLIFLFLSISTFTSCSKNTQNTNANQNFKKIKVSKFIELQNENTNNKDFLIIDLRTPNEIVQGKVKDSLEINFYSKDFKKQLNKLDKNKTYTIYCRSGGRSGSTMSIMKKLGFKNVYDIKGGIISLREEGYELE